MFIYCLGYFHTNWVIFMCLIIKMEIAASVSWVPEQRAGGICLSKQLLSVRRKDAKKVNVGVRAAWKTEEQRQEDWKDG